jgi:hypothetical protein
MVQSILELPVELRLAIYEQFELEDLSSHYGGLLLTCMTVRDEALPEMLIKTNAYYREYEKKMDGGDRPGHYFRLEN